jgi:hypothetical protein
VRRDLQAQIFSSGASGFVILSRSEGSLILKYCEILRCGSG